MTQKTLNLHILHACRMQKVTLDTNCIIDLEQNRVSAPYIKRLIQMHRNGNIILRVVAISASEQKPNGTYVSHLDEFKKRIASVGLANVEILATIFYLGLSFLGYCLFAGEKVTKLERKIQGILFPTVELEYSGYCKKRGLDPKNGKEWAKWINKKCDVLAIWSHIWYDGDIFVTRDKDFLEENKKSRLIALGAKKILTPDEAAEFCARAVT